MTNQTIKWHWSLIGHNYWAKYLSYPSFPKNRIAKKRFLTNTNINLNC